LTTTTTIIITTTSETTPRNPSSGWRGLERKLELELELARNER